MTNQQNISDKTSATRRCDRCILHEMYYDAVQVELQSKDDEIATLNEVIKTYRKIINN